jgi:hypothetical protein
VFQIHGKQETVLYSFCSQVPVASRKTISARAQRNTSVFLGADMSVFLSEMLWPRVTPYKCALLRPEMRLLCLGRFSLHFDELHS